MDGLLQQCGLYPTEIKYVDGSIYARRREDGKYILVPPEKVEKQGQSRRQKPPLRSSAAPLQLADTVFCFALGGAT